MYLWPVCFSSLVPNPYTSPGKLPYVPPDLLHLMSVSVKVHKVLNLSFSEAFAFGRKKWSWKNRVFVMLEASSLYIGPHLSVKMPGLVLIPALGRRLIALHMIAFSFITSILWPGTVVVWSICGGQPDKILPPLLMCPRREAWMDPLGSSWLSWSICCLWSKSMLLPLPHCLWWGLLGRNGLWSVFLPACWWIPRFVHSLLPSFFRQTARWVTTKCRSCPNWVEATSSSSSITFTNSEVISCPRSLSACCNFCLTEAHASIVDFMKVTSRPASVLLDLYQFRTLWLNPCVKAVRQWWEIESILPIHCLVAILPYTGWKWAWVKHIILSQAMTIIPSGIQDLSLSASNLLDMLLQWKCGFYITSKPTLLRLGSGIR